MLVEGEVPFVAGVVAAFVAGVVAAFVAGVVVVVGRPKGQEGMLVEEEVVLGGLQVLVEGPDRVGGHHRQREQGQGPKKEHQVASWLADLRNSYQEGQHHRHNLRGLHGHRDPVLYCHFDGQTYSIRLVNSDPTFVN